MILLLLMAVDIRVFLCFFVVVFLLFVLPWFGMEPSLYLFIIRFLNYSYRISGAGFTIHRVPFDLGRYKALDHGEDKHNPINPDR